MSADITIVGNLGDNPELRFTESGTPVANFSVGVTKRILQNDVWVDGPTSWYSCAAWRGLAENVGETLEKGMRVIVSGTMEMRTYEKDGETRYAWGINVRNVGVDLTFGTAKFTKSSPAKPEPPKVANNARRTSRSR